jgi:hypothetical protein
MESTRVTPCQRCSVMGEISARYSDQGIPIESFVASVDAAPLITPAAVGKSLA